jgi:hypothetical protein
VDNFSPADFRQPANEFRSVTFYSLNDELDADEMRRQLRGFQEGGFGGTFLHSRIGLLTEYLGEEWFQLMEAGVVASQELGLDAWFYDEDKWPSGFAGGIVPRQNPDFHARSLLRVKKEQPVNPPDTILCSDEAYHYVCHVFPMGDAWFNGTAWVDLMNPEMVRAFIDCSYVPYAEKFAGRERVLGMFTDEPQVNPRPKIPHEGAVPFSPVLLAAFQRRTGLELAPLLPALFSETGDWRQVRLEYFRTVAACFEDAFSRQIGDYCREAGLVWTGHYNAEENPRGGMNNEGGLMQQYRHMGLPGIDALGLRLQPLHCGKLMTSVANQYGQRRRLSELFGIAGQNLSFEDRIWLTAWHTLMGINFMCPHLTLYSIKGERKRDYPPTISAHQPWWRHNRLYEDYAARLCYFATAGEPVPEICVLNPIESDYLENASGGAEARDWALEQLLNVLQDTHRNVDLGDEQILSEIGHVEGARLHVGRMAYPIVVLPPLLTIRATTLSLLVRLAEEGGTVLVAESYPTLVDGREAPDALAALEAVAPPVPARDWAGALPTAPFTLEGEGAEQVWTHLRRGSDGYTLQLTNLSRLESRSLTLRFADGASATLLDPVDGRSLRLVPGPDGAYHLHFAPTQTWVVTTGEVSPVDGDYLPPGAVREEVLRLDGPWSGRRLDPNAITLDYARSSQDGGATWSEPEPVLATYDRFALGTPYHGPLLLKYEPEITELPATCRLAVEQPGMYTSVSVNGHPVDFAGGGEFYLDPVLRTRDITALLRVGRNEIVLALDFVSAVPTSADARTRYGTEIESIYLIGDFAVQARLADSPLTDTYRNQSGALPPKPVHSFSRYTLTRETAEFPGTPDLATRGYPFYAGEFELETTLELPAVDPARRLILTFPALEATVLRLTINGADCAPVFTSPWEVDVTTLLRPGANTVRLSLTNSLRNLLGPHHHQGGEHIAVGPATFRANHLWPHTQKGRGEPDWYDARRESRAQAWRDDYYHISFGLLEAPVLLSE